MNNFIIKKSYHHFHICRGDRYTEQMKAFLNNPDSVFNISDDLLMKNGNSATLVKSLIDGKKIVVKRYNMKTRLHAIRRAFKKSRADHSWKYAHILKDMGINTPYPIAIKEKRFGVFRNKAFFICDYIDGSTALDYFRDNSITDSAKGSMAEKIINIFNKLKSAMISHGDMKATNIIIHDNNPFILDLDSMKQHKSIFFFNRAWGKDMIRFMQNWNNLPEVEMLFRELQY